MRPGKLPQDIFNWLPDGSDEVPVSSHETIRWPPDGSQIAHMRPQDAPRSPPGDIREACVFIAPRGGLVEHVPNQEWCVLLWFNKPF